MRKVGRGCVSSPPGMNSVANAFAAPDAFAKLYANPSTAAFMRDPAFVEKLNQIRANPQLMQAHMGDQRILQALITLMGLSVCGV